MLVFDTSSIIHAWDEYPIEQFPKVWGWLESEISSANICFPEAIIDEVGHNSDGCYAYLKDIGATKIPLNNEILSIATNIASELGIVGGNYHRRGVDENDIIGIATAKTGASLLISDEARQVSPPMDMAKYKIPAVCDLPTVGVECCNFISLLKRTKIVF